VTASAKSSHAWGRCELPLGQTIEGGKKPGHVVRYTLGNTGLAITPGSAFSLPGHTTTHDQRQKRAFSSAAGIA